MRQGPDGPAQGRRTTTSTSCCPAAIKYPYRGKISFSDPSFSQDTGSFIVRAVLPNPKMRAAAGHVRDRRSCTARCGPTRSSCRSSPSSRAATATSSTSSTRAASRRSGRSSSATTSATRTSSIVQGLHAGDRVVVDGVLKVVPGKPVTIVPAAGEAPAARTRGRAAAKRPPRRRSSAAHVHALLHRPADPVVGHLDPDRARGRGRDERVADRAVPGAGAAAGVDLRELPGRDGRRDRQPGGGADRGAAERPRQPAVLPVDELVVGQRVDQRRLQARQRPRHQPGQRAEPRQPGDVAAAADGRPAGRVGGQAVVDAS